MYDVLLTFLSVALEVVSEAKAEMWAQWYIDGDEVPDIEARMRKAFEQGVPV